MTKMQREILNLRSENENLRDIATRALAELRRLERQAKRDEMDRAVARLVYRRREGATIQ